jgi:hypothetical protein
VHGALPADDLEDASSPHGAASMADVFASFVGDTDFDMGDADAVEQVKHSPWRARYRYFRFMIQRQLQELCAAVLAPVHAAGFRSQRWCALPLHSRAL